MKSITNTLSIAVVAFSLVAAVPAAAQHDHSGHGGEKLGTVDFPTSCNPSIRADFNRAVALLHSFEFSTAIQAFSGVLEKEPSCGVAYWGIVLSNWGNPFGGMRQPITIERGQAAVAKARAAAGAKFDARDRAYLDAAIMLFEGAPARPQRERTLAYEAAMESVTRSFPDDKEARIFYALAISQNALATDKTYANQLKAVGILEPLYQQYPDHPGLAHYIIHTYDTPALASRGLDAARRYATIAPSAPHALHMPSHTFTRVGAWRESIDSNIKSADAALRDNALSEVLHALDYETYAFLQLAQDRKALEIRGRLDALAQRFDPTAMGNAAPGLAGDYALAAIPARYALERGAWQEAAALTPRSSAFPFVRAITHFARALGAARAGDVDSARRDVEQLAELRAALEATKDGYWTEQVEIQRQVAAAWTAWADGEKDQAIAALRAAADREDATDKSAVSPGPIKPARELLGEMLLAANRPAEALVAFEATVQKEPNRFWGVYGAGRAAELAGNREKASRYYAALVDLCREADAPARAELTAARGFLGRS
jgi:hypothetical protein